MFINLKLILLIYQYCSVQYSTQGWFDPGSEHVFLPQTHLSTQVLEVTFCLYF